jgi:hypothetical protein
VCVCVCVFVCGVFVYVYVCVCVYACVRVALHIPKSAYRDYILHTHGFWRFNWFNFSRILGTKQMVLQPRNINVSFNNNSNVPIDVIIFTFYSDQLTIDVETGIVTK